MDRQLQSTRQVAQIIQLGSLDRSVKQPKTFACGRPYGNARGGKFQDVGGCIYQRR